MVLLGSILESNKERRKVKMDYEYQSVISEAIPESIDKDKHVIATYLVTGYITDVIKFAEFLATEQSTGT